MPTPHLRRPSGRSRRRLVALLATPALVAPMMLTAGASPASAEPIGTSPVSAPALAPDGAEPVAVTLITGDTVYWRDNGDGGPRVVEIEESPRNYPVTFDQSGTKEDFYIIPTDVRQHVVAGTVDRELFNIPGLIRQGLADAASNELPVIVTFDRNRSIQQLARDADTLPGTRDATVLKKVNGAGVRVERDKAGTFRHAVFGEPDGNRATDTAGALGLDADVERIRLDQMLKIDLAESVPQIGAPEAWDAGYTGEGITVAVLDTGVDSGHPDLAGQVVAAENFTDELDATDTHGHGTHVASTIAGTGAASDGVRRGVAPDAELVIGKVCNAQGDCPTSAIIAGMEWAAAQGADIVNMSLGGAPTDGTDLLSQVVNHLSAETDSLFVISAGNLGNRDRRLRVVGSPAAADAALAVGAVDKFDEMADFSSRGPRVGDHAVKPEITAPGVGIVAARAEGTSRGGPVDGHYTALDGTSMASPHVAGAAALLAQASGLTGGDLKDALVSTTVDGGFRWYQQGTGRLNIPTALDTPVYAQGAINFGGIDGEAERDLVYTNRSSDDITLMLEATVTGVEGDQGGGVSLSTDILTVPAHGTASVAVTVTLKPPATTGNGSFGGVISAVGPGVALRTGVGFGPPLHRVTIDLLDSNGDHIGTDTAPDQEVALTHDTWEPESGDMSVYKILTSEGIAVGHVPTGTYTFVAIVEEYESGAPSGSIARANMLVKVEVEVAADIRIVLDARDAVAIQMSVPRAAQKRNHSVTVIRQIVGAGGPTFTEGIHAGNVAMYATPTPPGKLAPVGLFVNWTLAEPQPVQPIPWDRSGLCPSHPHRCYSDTPSYVYNLPILYENGIPDNLHERVARSELVKVPTRFHAYHTDALVEQGFLAMVPFAPGFFDNVTISFRPGPVTEYYLVNDHVTWLRRAPIERRPEGEAAQYFTLLSDDRFPVAEAGESRPEERWHDAPFRTGTWDVREESLANAVLIERWATGSRVGPEGERFAVPFQLMGNIRGHGIDHTAATWRMWNTDTGTELEGTGLIFPLTSGAATYRLEQVVDLPASFGFVTGQETTTTWTFTSIPSDERVPQRYKCLIQQVPRQDICQIQPLIRLEYDLGLDIYNRVRAGRAHMFTITAGHHSKAINRAPVTSLQVQASFDDGNTWHSANVLGKPRNSLETGGFLPAAAPYQQFKVLLRTPQLSRTTGSVTLRVRAADANGGTIDETMRRAYLLK